MDFLGSHLLPSLISAIIGLVVGVIFEDYLKNIVRNIQRKIRRMFKTDHTNISHLFSIENLDTNFFVVEGDGVIEFKQENIECRIVDTAPTLPGEITSLRETIAEEELKREAKGLDHKWNGSLYGLSRYITTRAGNSEEPSAVFHFHLTDYYTFLATNMQLDYKLSSGKTIREKYIPRYNLEQVQPILANGFGVVLVVITGDEEVILIKRASTSGARANGFDVSVVEGVHPTLDQDPLNEGPNLFKAAIRGAYEELGLEIDEKQIRFLGYGIDLDFYQWNIIGHVHIKETAKEVVAIRSRGASGKWESKQIVFENFTPKNIAHLIVYKPMWSTAKVALYWTAVKHLGKNNIDRAIKNLTK